MSGARPGLRTAALLAALLAGPAWAAPPPDRARIERQLESVATLLERSSAARQVELSGAAQALDRRDQAREAYRQARHAYDAGQLDEAAGLLHSASRLMLEAVRAATPAQADSDRAKSDYASRGQSVKALLTAYRRIGGEKGVGNEVAETSRGIEQLIQEAARQAAQDNYPRANTLLQQAYLTAKAAVGTLRQGDTLVRSLSFANKEEEFHYELDRNDTHQMLVKLMLGEKRAGAALSGLVRGFLEKAGLLRGQAEAAAAQGDHDTAVRRMEESTGELVRAIRSAGVFIPG